MLTNGGRRSFTVSTEEKGRKKGIKQSPPAQTVGRDAILGAAMFDVQLASRAGQIVLCATVLSLSNITSVTHLHVRSTLMLSSVDADSIVK
jgi:hypothetical protein